MDWPNWVRPDALFPSLFSTQPTGAVPQFDPTTPAWAILDPTSAHGLKAQLLQAINDFSQATQDPRDSGATIDESQGPVVVHASAKLEPSAHFIGPCLVEADAEVRHGAYVRPFSWICAGAVVGHNTEVKHSILLPGAKAPHFNYVGDSILGRDVNLGAGTKLSNLRNDGGEVHLRLDGSRHRQRPAEVRRGARRRVPAWVQQRYQSRNRSWATERRMAERDRDGAPS